MVKNPIISDIRERFLKTTDLKAFRGFTLAEVLITLVIIGVIASMTIPTLMNNTNKQEYVSRFKKNYASFSQAINMAQSQNGPLTIWDWGTQQQGFNNVEKYILPHLQVAENCKNTTNCSLDYDWKLLNGNSWLNYKTNTTHYKFVLNDGVAVAVYVRPSCIENSVQCMDIHFDVNGSKGPNRRGKDIFTLCAYPHTNDLQPAGVREWMSNTYDSVTGLWALNSKNNIDNNCKSSGDGTYCSAKIILEGYKMNY